MFVLVNKDICRSITLYSYSVGPSAGYSVKIDINIIIDVVSRSICTRIEKKNASVHT